MISVLALGGLTGYDAAATSPPDGSGSPLHGRADGAALGYATDTSDSVHYGVLNVRINEIRINQNGQQNDEYFELAGPVGIDLDGLTYIVLNNAPAGRIEAVVPLTGQIPASGYFVVAEDSFTLGTPDQVAELNFQNNDTATHMLVDGFTGMLDQDLDANADGILTPIPWMTLLDTVAILSDPVTGISYGPSSPTCVAGPTCQEVGVIGATPYQVYRCPDSMGTWLVGSNATSTTDTPGAPNFCPVCGDGIVEAGEECDGDGAGAGGETAACDIDCTDAMCGDGTTNMTAGETCDDMVETATCDDDCTDAMCGDGTTNMAAGETCDDMGETAACDDDCTDAMCGDGTVNMTAGEACDGMGETATCNVDCTTSMCGDNIVNNTAGETCDDGNTDDGDGCSATCISETCGNGLVDMDEGEQCDGDGMGTPGETPDCDDDCTMAMCGDMHVNTMADEECDEGGETEDCDDDCTEVMCGDGVTNMAAGEACDDAGNSAQCDADCTEAECGDGTINQAAGEQCDDGNTDDGDGCAADCSLESGEGSSGGEDSTGDSGLDGTAGSSGSPSDDSTTGSADTGSGTGDTDSAGGVPVPLDGCGCTSDPTGGRRRTGAAWSVLALLGLGALRRRRRRAA